MRDRSGLDMAWLSNCRSEPWASQPSGHIFQQSRCRIIFFLSTRASGEGACQRKSRKREGKDNNVKSTVSLRSAAMSWLLEREARMYFPSN